MRRDVELRSHAYRFHAPRSAASSSRRSLSPPLRPRALLRGVGALNVLDQCSARSPRSVLEMVGASSRRTPRLQFPKHSRDRNAVGKRWGARGSIFRFFGPSCRLARGASQEERSGTLFSRDEGGQPFGRARAHHLIQVGCSGPRLWLTTAGKSEAQPPGALPPPGAACAGGAPNRPRPRARAVRPARGNPWGRSGRLHAPEAARTGPVNALRRYSSWSPPGRWLNGHNGHFSCQPGRYHVCQLPGPYGSGFNGPRAVLNFVPPNNRLFFVYSSPSD